jgi:Glycosyltransferase family 87
MLRPAPAGSAVTTRPSARALREALAATALAGIVVLCFLLAAGAASGASVFVHGSHRTRAIDFAYPDWLAGPLRGLAAPLTVSGWIELVAGLCVLYLVVLLVADVIRPAWAVAALVVTHVLLALAPPLWLSDVFNYIGFARLGVTHGLEPYGHTLGAIPTDPAAVLASWHRIPSPYGPLFTVLSYPLAPLGVPAATWVVKATMALAALGSLALVWRLAPALGRDPVPAVLFVGLNPMWLVFEVGGAHNDALALLFVLGGALWVLRRRDGLGGAALAAATAVKASAGLALPFVWIAARRRWRTAAGAAVVGAAVVVGSALAFGGDVSGALDSFRGQARLTSLRSVPGLLADAVLHRGSIPHALELVFFAVFAVVAVILFFIALRDRAWASGLGWTTLVLLLSVTWLMPWYAAWVLPFAAIGESRRLREATLLLTVFLIVVRMPYGAST